MTKRNAKYPSDGLPLGLVLAAAGGAMDAYTYLTRGRVFANAMTGNLVLLGVRAVEGDPAALHYLVPIAFFVVGVLVTECIRTHRHGFRRLHWRQAVVAVEALVLLLAAFAPQSCNDLVNAGVSFACALQVGAFRNFSGNIYATTMCTGNLRSGTEKLYDALRKKDKAALRAGLGYFAVILTFVLGGAAGGLLASRWGEITALFPAALLCIACMMMHVRPKE